MDAKVVNIHYLFFLYESEPASWLIFVTAPCSDYFYSGIATQFHIFWLLSLGNHLLPLSESPFMRHQCKIHELEARAGCRNAVFDVSKLELTIIISQPH